MHVEGLGGRVGFAGLIRSSGDPWEPNEAGAMRKLVHPDPAVPCDAVSSRVTGWNILRASMSRKVYENRPKELLRAPLVAKGKTGSSGRLQGRLWVLRSPGIDRWVQSTNLHWKVA